MTRRRRRRLLSAAVVVAVAGAVAVTVALVRDGDTTATAPPRPTPAALAASDVSALAWDLPALDGGGRLSLAEFRGKPTVVSFFTSSCPACDEGLPFFRSAVSSYRDRVNFVFVDTADSGDWRTVVERHQLTGLHLAADVRPDLADVGDGLYRAAGGTGSLPFTVFYASDGSLVQATDRSLVGGTLRQALQQVYGIGA